MQTLVNMVPREWAKYSSWTLPEIQCFDHKINISFHINIGVITEL